MKKRNNSRRNIVERNSINKEVRMLDLHPVLKKFLIISIIAFFSSVIILTIKDKIYQIYDKLNKEFIDFTTITEENIVLIGSHSIKKENLIESINFSDDKSFFNINIEEIKKQILKINYINDAAIVKIFPNKLVILIKERQPFAFYTNEDNSIFIIDDKGFKLTKVEKTNNSLIKISGNNSIYNIENLVNILESNLNWRDVVKEAIFIGKRRWDIVLINDVVIKLPENQAQQAWFNLDQFYDKQNLLLADLKYIDLRIEGRAYLNKKNDRF